MADPYGTRPRGAPAPPPPRVRRRPRWVILWLPVVAAALVAFGVAVLVAVEGRGNPPTRLDTAPPMGSPVPSSELEGRWTGEGAVTWCAGYDDEDCSGTRSIALTIDCSGKRCAVMPFDREYGSPPLRYEGGTYRAAGPVSPDAAPTCGGVPTHTALWRLELALYGGRLSGSYTEATVQSFDCGATGVTWEVALERS